MDPNIEQVPMASRGASNLLGKPGTKTKSPLPLDKAKSYLERFVEKQKRKDYLTELPAEKNVKKSSKLFKILYFLDTILYIFQKSENFGNE